MKTYNGRIPISKSMNTVLQFLKKNNHKVHTVTSISNQTGVARQTVKKVVQMFEFFQHELYETHRMIYMTTDSGRLVVGIEEKI